MRSVSLTPKHGIRYTLRLSLRGWPHLLLTSRRSHNRTISRAIGDALECVGNTGQLECDLFGSARPLQHDDSFSAEVKCCPEQEPNHQGYNGHEHVVTRNREASTRDGNQVIREQSFLPRLGLLDCLSAVGAKPLRSVTY
jgi:hypothetical protein